MFSITLGQYTIGCDPDKLPDLYDHYVQRARLYEEFDLQDSDGQKCFLSIRIGVDWPFLVVAQRYNSAGGFSPGALLIPETGLLFIGVGERLLAYKLNGPERLWIDRTEFGFWGWARHDDFVVLSAEVEIAAWDIHGRKCWSSYVEPPWTYRVSDGMVYLEDMERKSCFPIELGPR